jgi:hypothetical protein
LLTRPCDDLSGNDPFWPLHEYIWKASWSEYTSRRMPDQAEARLAT